MKEGCALILIDTNILVYAINKDAPQYEACRSLVQAGMARSFAGVLFTQNILEFYSIVTDIRRVPNPLEPAAAWEQINNIKTIFPILEPSGSTLSQLEQTVFHVKGPEVFDAYLVAQMRVSGVSTICTYNKKHFQKYAGIVALQPEEIVQ